MQAESGETVRWGVQRRLEFIDFRLFWDGRFNRRDLAETFGISAQQASSDIAQYTARAPDNLVYDQTLKAYLRTATYEPKLMHASAERYLLQLVAIENRWMRQEDTWFDSKPPIENVSLLRKRTDAKILLSILDAINRHGQIEVQYKSISGSPEPSRIIAPHSLFYAVNRWYVRSWSKDHSDFRDYNLFRINHVGDISPAKIDASLDFEWEHQIDLILAPNPLLSLSQQAALEEEYGMSEGRLIVTKRLSQSFYIMTEHNLDVASGILPPEKQQLILINREEVVSTRATARKMSIDAIGRISR
ncbi:WYL domain-containing protein [Sphingomonas sp. CFBP 13728]|uniref:WYL domain-containing protein n=1 Tax=Sphingomonas sp. CFBP 13728 TaxID=2775294 RepID=UPI00315887BB